jgi:16S rRNA (guanine966-N2)-methyltransferase
MSRYVMRSNGGSIRGRCSPWWSVAARRKSTAHSVRRTSSAGYPGQIRIIGGQWRGRRLPVLHAEGLRPTPDRVRETVFNWLAPYLPGARCLDLFAGTGALCLEALSRGAAAAVLVERSTALADHLRSLVQTLSANATVITADAVDYLARFAHRAPTREETFDIVFIDPPFASDLIEHCSALVASHGVLRPGGLAYIEAPSRMKRLPLPPGWELLRTQRAGQVGYHLARSPAAL